jgi:hypothetical protein
MNRRSGLSISHNFTIGCLDVAALLLSQPKPHPLGDPPVCTRAALPNNFMMLYSSLDRSTVQKESFRVKVRHRRNSKPKHRRFTNERESPTVILGPQQRYTTRHRRELSQISSQTWIHKQHGMSSTHVPSSALLTAYSTGEKSHCAMSPSVLVEEHAKPRAP